MEEKNVLVISGPTGSGESTVTKEIIERYPVFTRLVTATSRAPRLREEHGVDYYFFSKEDFQKEIEKGTIGEHTYVENRDTYYGTYIPDLTEKLSNGKKIIANMDHVGLKYYKENYNASSIFIDVTSLDVIAERLKKRNPDFSQEELDKRLANAKDEIDQERSFYDHMVVNEENKLEQTIEKVIKILQEENYGI